MWYLINHLVSPKKFFNVSKKITPWLTTIFLLTSPYGIVGGLILAPADYLQGDGFRIIYVHAPCAFLSLFIFTVMATAAVAGIVLRLKLAFLVIRHSAPIGAGFTLLALITGSLWGKPMWGTGGSGMRVDFRTHFTLLYIGVILLQSALAKTHG